MENWFLNDDIPRFLRRGAPRARPSVQDELLLSPPRQGELASAKSSS